MGGLVWIVNLYWFGCYFFFFQAEDGIRDVAVTGVQTCALPIWFGSGCVEEIGDCFVLGEEFFNVFAEGGIVRASLVNERSEERRVGKECRSRWSPYH